MWKFCSTTNANNIVKRYSTALNVSKLKNVGDAIGRFKVEQLCEVPEFDLKAIKLQHPCGAQMLHLSSSDTHNTFSAGFRTIPLESTGLPHILEHTVLCGSKRYPCRDPFFNMLNRSLASFMNAMTAPDYTIYPFSSQVPADISNLRSVYLDAVFRPNLTLQDFQQEGWRLEHENPHDPSTPILIKGVVFNEMKGVFSDNQSLFGESLLNNILPSHTYGVCSGGEPMDIPKLTHKDLIKFHKDHYAPWNARFFTFGNLPMEEHIRDIEGYLENGGMNNANSTAVPSESRWQQPRSKHIACRNDPLAAEPEKQSSIVLSYLCCDATDLNETLILQLLSQLLLRGPNAPFYRTLVEPNIGAGLSPASGYESSTRDTFFSVGLQNVSPKDFDMIESLIEKTLHEVMETGFQEQHIAAVLHGIELGLKRRGSNFGLGLLFGVSPIWNHDGDVIAALQVEQRLSNLRKTLVDDPRLLQKKIEQYLISNSHRLRLTMSPNEQYEENLKKKEAEILKEKLNNLDEIARKKIYEEGLELLKLKEINNKQVLPTLKPQDIPREVPKVATKTINLSHNVPMMIIKQPTNGVSYFRAILPLNEINEDLLPLVSTFASVLTSMGTKTHEFREFDQIVSLHTDGLNASAHVLDDISKLGTCEESLAIGSYCLERNVDVMFNLWTEVIKEVDLNNTSRFETLIRGLAADMVNSLAMSGHRVASLASASLINQTAGIRERHSGISFVNQLQKITANENFSSTLEQLKRIQQYFVDTASARCCYTSRDGNENISPLIALKGSNGPEFKTYASIENSKGVFYVLPFDLSFAGRSIQTVPYQEPDFAALRILARFISMKYFHPEIREKGGAYGSGMSISSNGLLTCYSYRDPTPSRTFETFDKTLSWIKSIKLTTEDIDEAKLGVFQSVDAPVAAGDKGCLEFLYGVSDEALSTHRKELLAVTIDDLIRVAELYFKPDVPTGRCVLGPNNDSLLNDTRYHFKLVDFSKIN